MIIIHTHTHTNVFYFTQIFFVRPFEQGDRVDIEGIVADVLRVNLLSTIVSAPFKKFTF